MTPRSILYVDDEAMALKYFERLVAPLAPVITALSVAEGKAVLQQRGAEVAVLVTDQRMPVAHGNELLRYAREHHPGVVRMLTTAYSELGEAIEAINSGEIYRYITKPWDLESLHADLRNALELAELRAERDGLLREKLLMQQQQLLGHRAGQLALACAGFLGRGADHALHVFLRTAASVGCPGIAIDWRALDHAQLMEFEAQRGIAIGKGLAGCAPAFDSLASPAGALAGLAEAVPGHARLQGDAVVVDDAAVFTDLLAGPPQQQPSPAQLAWLGWLLRWSAGVDVTPAVSGWEVRLDEESAAPGLPRDWLAAGVEQLQEAVRQS